jgi:hypothetical protein
MGEASTSIIKYMFFLNQSEFLNTYKLQMYLNLWLDKEFVAVEPFSFLFSLLSCGFGRFTVSSLLLSHGDALKPVLWIRIIYFCESFLPSWIRIQYGSDTYPDLLSHGDAMKPVLWIWIIFFL